MNNPGLVLIISGPSGSGKDSVLQEVRKNYPQMAFSVSCITRERRGSDKEDGKYEFLTVDQFKKGLDEGAFLEYNEYLGNYYGTPRRPVMEAIESGDGIIIEVDVNGAASIRRALPEAISVFIMPPSVKALKERLENRKTDTPEQIQKRLNAALREIPRAEEYDYIIVNDDLKLASQQLCDIIKTSELTSYKQKNIIKEVLNNA